jgi:hypothetical protein
VGFAFVARNANCAEPVTLFRQAALEIIRDRRPETFGSDAQIAGNHSPTIRRETRLDGVLSIDFHQSAR